MQKIQEKITTLKAISENISVILRALKIQKETYLKNFKKAEVISNWIDSKEKKQEHTTKKYDEKIRELQQEINDQKIKKERIRLKLVNDKIQELTKNPKSTENFILPDFLRSIHINKKIIFIESRIIRKEVELIDLAKERKLDPSKHKVSNLSLIRNKLALALKKMRQKKLIEQILGDENSTTRKNIQNFIQEFNSGKHGSEEVRMFISKIVKEYLEKQGEVEDDFEDQVYLAFEEYIFPKIYNQCMKYIDDEKADKIISDKCEKYADITQEQLHIPKELVSQQLVPYVDSIAYLKTLLYSSTPTDKMYSILNSAQAIYNQVSSQSENTLVGADQFVDILNYVVIKSGITKLRTNISFIQEFSNQELLNTELGYYLVSLDLSATFIEKLEDEKLLKSIYNVSNQRIFQPEKQKFSELVKRTSFIEIESEEEVLEGYQLYAVAEWAYSMVQFRSTFLVQTGNPKDKVKGCIIKLKDSIPDQQQSFIHKNFFESTIPQIVLHELENGFKAFTSEPPFESTKYTVFLIPNGDYEKSFPLLKTNLNLIRLVRDKQHEFRNIENFQDLEKKFIAKYPNEKSKTTQENIETIVFRIQNFLKLLDLFPYFTKLPGIIDELTVFGIQSFKKRFLPTQKNQTEEEEQQQKAKQEMNQRLYQNMLTTLNNYFSMLQILGFIPQGAVLLENIEKFPEFIKNFQVSSNIFSDGRIGTKTADKLSQMVGLKKFVLTSKFENDAFTDSSDSDDDNQITNDTTIDDTQNEFDLDSLNDDISEHFHDKDENELQLFSKKK